MRSKVSKSKRTLKSEERRAIIYLGYFTAAVALRLDLERALEAGQTPFINFFCNSPCPHLTVYSAQTLNVLIGSWVFYTIFIVLYFSEDWFHSWGRRGKQVREVCRRFANFFWFAYPFSFGAFTFIAAFSFLIPQQYQSVYWTLGIYALTAVGVTLFEIITGERKTLRNTGETILYGFKVWTELAIEGFLPALERIVKQVSKGRIPPKFLTLRAKVKRLLAIREGRPKIRYWERQRAK